VVGAAGVGGTAEVMRARDRSTGRDVALKIMRVDADARFEREVEILASVRHPRVVGYVAHGRTDDGRAFVALEWIDGETLADRLEREGLTADAAIRIVASAARAIGDLHVMGLVHRDLKPANLMLRGDDVVIMDFGIARGVHSESITSTNMFVGTPAYIAPEQAQGAREVDARADVYSLACVLFECLTGKRPFEGSDILSVLAKVISEPAPSVDAARGDLPTGLTELLARTMAKNPQERPADGAAFAAELEALPSVQSLGDDARQFIDRDKRVRTIVVLSPMTAAAVSAAGEFGGVAQLRADGSAVISFEGGPTEQALAAARCALAIRAVCPSQLIVATGKSDASFVDHAVGMVMDSRHGVRVDSQTVALLGSRVDLEVVEGGAWLRPAQTGERTAKWMVGRGAGYLGRTVELDLLASTFASCLDDYVVRIVSIVGPPGIGKSKLAEQAVKRIARTTPNLRAIEAGGHRGRPRGLAAAIIRAAVSVRDGDTRERALAKLKARLTHRGVLDRAMIGQLGALIGASSIPNDESWLIGDRLREAFIEWLAAELSVAPMVMVLDDLQWADDASIALLDHALERLQDKPLFVVALSADDIDERCAALFRGRSVTRLRLEPLQPTVAEKIVRGMIPALDDTIVGRIVDRARGNPLFLEELVRATADGCDLPDSVLAILQARLDALDPDARSVVAAASVLGNELTVEGIAAVLSREPAALTTTVNAVVRAGLLDRVAQGTLVFHNELVRDAAYASFPEAARADAHRAAGEWLSQSEQHDSIAIAEHFERAGDGARAVPWLVRATRETMLAGDSRGALALIERGVRAGAAGHELGTLRAIEGQALAWLGDWTGVIRVANEALVLLDAEDAYRPAALAGLAVGASFRGDGGNFARAVAELRRASESSRVTGFVAFAAYLVAVGLCLVGQRTLAREVCAPFFAANTVGDPLSTGWILLCRGTIEEAEGHPIEEVLSTFRASLAEFRTIRADLGLISALRYTGRALTALGRYDEAITAFEEALSLSGRTIAGANIGLTQNLYARALLAIGRVADARRLAAAQLAQFDAEGFRFGIGQSAIVLALASLADGDLEGAERFAAHADEAESTLPMSRAHTLAVRGEIARRRGELDRARALAREGHALLASSGGFAAAQPALDHLSRALA